MVEQKKDKKEEEGRKYRVSFRLYCLFTAVGTSMGPQERRRKAPTLRRGCERVVNL